MLIAFRSDYLHIPHCFLHQCCQPRVSVGIRTVSTTDPMWSQVPHHQVKVVSLQSPDPERLADGADVRQT